MQCIKRAFPNDDAHAFRSPGRLTSSPTTQSSELQEMMSSQRSDQWCVSTLIHPLFARVPSTQDKAQKHCSPLACAYFSMHTHFNEYTVFNIVCVIATCNSGIPQNVPSAVSWGNGHLIVSPEALSLVLHFLYWVIQETWHGNTASAQS